MTLEEAMALSGNKLNRKAAELDGWTGFRSAPHVLDDSIWGIPPEGKRTLASPWNPSIPAGQPVPEPLPDYLNDIAAAWELRDSFKSVDDQYEYVSALAQITLQKNWPEKQSDQWEMIHASPCDRTRAFILAMTQEDE